MHVKKDIIIHIKCTVEMDPIYSIVDYSHSLYYDTGLLLYIIFYFLLTMNMNDLFVLSFLLSCFFSMSKFII